MKNSLLILAMLLASPVLAQVTLDMGDSPATKSVAKETKAAPTPKAKKAAPEKRACSSNFDGADGLVKSATGNQVSINDLRPATGTLNEDQVTFQVAKSGDSQLFLKVSKAIFSVWVPVTVCKTGKKLEAQLDLTNTQNLPETIKKEVIALNVNVKSDIVEFSNKSKGYNFGMTIN